MVDTRARPDRRAIVIGGSISGLYAALLLSRHGWRVDVYERTPGALAGRGAGIVAQPELRAALAAAGLDDIPDVGVHVADRVLLDRSGALLMRHPCPQTVTSWEYVYGLLRARLPQDRYHAGCELRHIGPGATRSTAHFVTGLGAEPLEVEADLIIGADGIRSTVRQQLFPDAKPEYAGYVAWRCLVDEAAFSPQTHADVFWTFAFGLPAGEQFISYPVTGPGDDLTPGRLRYNFVWYRPADEAVLKDLLTDERGHVHALSIPPPLISAKARAGMRADAARLLAPQFQEVIAMAPLPFLQPIYDLESSRLAQGHVALIGDAAFVARPHVAAGVIKAVDDVLALVAALEKNTTIPAALAHYEAARLPVGRRIIAKARSLGENYRSLAAAGGKPRLGDRDLPYASDVVVDTALMTFLNEA